MERWYIPKNYPKLSASFWEFLATKSQRMHKQGLHYQWSTSHHTTSLWIALRSLPCTLHSFSWTTSDGSTKIPSVSLRLYQSQLGWFIHYIQSQDFTDYLNTSNVETFGGFLKHVIYQALSIFVPTITIKAHHRPKWFTSALQHQLNQLATYIHWDEGFHLTLLLLTRRSFSLLSRIFNLLLVMPNIVMKTTLSIFPQTETVQSTNIFLSYKSQ